MTLRRYTPLKPSAGTRIPESIRAAGRARDGGCLGPAVGMPGDCAGAIEVDHVQASHGMGMKSETEAGNLASLCGAHHRMKTLEGRRWRPRLLAYIATARWFEG